MAERAPHPRDEWVEFRTMGERTPRLLLVTDGREVEIAEAQAAYVYDYIDVETLAHRVEAALR